jgi:glucose/arabinose dehydrogenase
MIFYTGDAFSNWRGDLFVGSLKFDYLVRLDIDGGKIVGEERLIEDLDQRVRDGARAPTATCICSPTRTRARSSNHAGIEVLTISDG